MEGSGTAAKWRAAGCGLLLTMLLVASVFVARPAYATTFTVDLTADFPDPNLGDDECVVSIFGGCTLRAAIGQANATDGADTIRFNIPGSGPHTISPASALPFITETLTIDGYSQPGTGLNTNPGRTFVIQFFSNPGDDEGKRFIGQRRVTTDENGKVSFSFSPSRPVRVGATITATATGPDGSTSEFSVPRAVVAT